MRIAIVEDEGVVADRIARLVTEILADRIETMTVLEDFATAREHLASHAVDVLFLDLNLKGRDGFDLLEDALSSSFATIVVSAHHDQALRAFELGVTDFVPKPFGRERLARSLARVEEREPSLRQPLRTLAVRSMGRVDLVAIDRLVYVRGAGDYAALHLDDGRRYLHHKNLEALERLLPDRFVRLHRSFLADLRHVGSLRSHGGGRYRVTLSDGTELPVSRERIVEIRQRLKAQSA